MGLGSSVPAMADPGPPNQATNGDDRVGEVEECVDDDRVAFVAAGQAGEGVLPSVGGRFEQASSGGT